MFHCRDVIGQVMSGASFPPNVILGIQAKEFNHGLIRPEHFVSHGQSSLGAFWQIPSGLSFAFY
jgi:hypothetical protein